MKKYKVLFLSHERKLGGATISLLELCKALKADGHEVYVSVLFHGCLIDKALNEAGIPTVPAFYGWWQMPQQWNWVLKICFRLLHMFQFIPCIKLARFIKKKDIDVIHTNSSTLDIGLQLKKRTGIRHVYHFREFGEADFGLEYLNGRKKSLDEISQYSDEIIFISKALRESYLDLTCNEKIHIIYNAVTKTYYVEKKDTKRNVRFLQTGTINPGKNQLLVVKAAKTLRDRGITNFTVFFAGEATSLQASKEYKSKILKYIESEKLDNVVLLGRRSDMEDVRKNVDFEIVPSKCEAFGRVTAEAMMSGIPVIASNTGANVELVDEEVTGFIFSCDDTTNLADVMEKAIVNCDQLLNMRSDCRRYAVEKFSISRLVSDIVHLYSKY